MAGRDDDLAAAEAPRAGRRGRSAPRAGRRGRSAQLGRRGRRTEPAPLVAVKLGADGGLATDGALMIRVTGPGRPARRHDWRGRCLSTPGSWPAGWAPRHAEALRCGRLRRASAAGRRGTEGQATWRRGGAGGNPHGDRGAGRARSCREPAGVRGTQPGGDDRIYDVTASRPGAIHRPLRPRPSPAAKVSNVARARAISARRRGVTLLRGHARRWIATSCPGRPAVRAGLGPRRDTDLISIHYPASTV